ncbi:MAG: type II secretion system secretin GspD [Geminicoccaceae bacterium]
MSIHARAARLGLGLAIAGTMPGCSADQPSTNISDRSVGRQSLGVAERLVHRDHRSGGATKLVGDLAPDDEAGRLSEAVVERGTGRLIDGPRPSVGAGLRRDDAGAMTLNVVDADIRDVARLVLEDGLNVSYVIDPAVSGKVTIRTSGPVPAVDMLPVLNSVLNLNGAALVEQGDVYKVVPLDQALAAGGKIGIRSALQTDTSGAGIQVAPLRYADAAKLAGLLQPFVAKYGSVQIDAAHNTLLLVGLPDQIATMNDLIDMFDVDWMQGMSFGLYPLAAVEPIQLAGELEQLFGDPETGLPAGLIRFVPLDRLNALLVITVQPDYLTRVERWIKRLDKAGDGKGEQVYVYAVQNGRASDLASVLGELFDIRSTSVGEASLLAPGAERVELRSSFLAAGPDDDGADNGTARPRPAGRPSSAGSFGQRDLTPGRDDVGTRIVADETNNALLIRATAKDYRKIRAALRDLDTLPLQVLLEATIAEVSLEDELSYGVQWFFGSGESGVTLSEFGSGAVGQSFPGFSGLLSRGDVRAVVNALDSVSDVKVISSPQILVLDNQTAQLEVGDEVPIVTQQAEGIDTGDARIVNTVEQRQTGVILEVTPRVNANGLVILDIQQEVSDVVRTTTSGIDSPTIAQRRIGTSVAVGSDQTVALGGLIQDDVDELRSGVPILQDIPFLGSLFSSTTKVTSRTELLVLITPKVLRNEHEASAATKELRRRLASLEPLHAKLHNGRTDPDHEPQPVDEVPKASEPRAEPDAVRPSAVFRPVARPSQLYAPSAWHEDLPGKDDLRWDMKGLIPPGDRPVHANPPADPPKIGPFVQSENVDRSCAMVDDGGPHCLLLDAQWPLSMPDMATGELPWPLWPLEHAWLEETGPEQGPPDRDTH